MARDRQNRRAGMSLDDQYLELGDEYDSDYLQSDSLTQRILASRDPNVAALMKQQSAAKKKDVAKDAAILGGVDLLARGLQAGLSPTLGYARKEAKRIDAARKSGTLGKQQFEETLRASKGITGAAASAGARSGLAALAGQGQGNLKKTKAIQNVAMRQGQEAEQKAFAIAEQSRLQSIQKDLSKYESIQQFFGQTLDSLAKSFTQGGVGLVKFLGAAKAYEGTKDLPAVAQQLKTAFPGMSDEARSGLLDKFVGKSEEERNALINDLQSSFGERQGQEAAAAPAAEAAAPAAITPPAAAVPAAEAPAAPAAPQSREVDGIGGYTYSQAADGTVTVTGAPNDKQFAVGREYTAASPVGQAITNEIGAFPAQEPQAQSAEGRSIVDSIRQATQPVEKRTEPRGDAATEQQIIDQGLNAEQSDALRKQKREEQALQRAQGQVPVTPATLPTGPLANMTQQQASARQPDHYTSAADFSNVGPRGEYIKFDLGEQGILYLNPVTERFHLSEGDNSAPGIDSFRFEQLPPSLQQAAEAKKKRLRAQDAAQPDPFVDPALRKEGPQPGTFDIGVAPGQNIISTVEQSVASPPATPPAAQPDPFVDPALRTIEPQPEPQPGTLDIGVLPGQNIIAQQPAGDRAVDDIVAGMQAGATPGEVAAGTAAMGGASGVPVLNMDVVNKGFQPGATQEEVAASQAELMKAQGQAQPAPAPAPAESTFKAPGTIPPTKPLNQITEPAEAARLMFSGGLSTDDPVQLARVLSLGLSFISQSYSGNPQILSEATAYFNTHYPRP
tara:strand:- start:2746 stop:5109 length:2364 start_codon:yes stop_codon:yes gene_type:complete